MFKLRKKLRIFKELEKEDEDHMLDYFESQKFLYCLKIRKKGIIFMFENLEI